MLNTTATLNKVQKQIRKKIAKILHVLSTFYQSKISLNENNKSINISQTISNRFLRNTRTYNSAKFYLKSIAAKIRYISVFKKCKPSKSITDLYRLRVLINGISRIINISTLGVKYVSQK